ncbi:MAG: class I SAM-dependent methyltransferase [Anaerolineae bacterium]|nr:class I SAM-dependent methyltransferase [Anaerolineae bacterium]
MSDKTHQSKQPLFDHFGLLAPVYERLIRPPQSSPLFELMSPMDVRTVLDVGGGTGRCSQLFAERDARIVVVDVSYPMLVQSGTHVALSPVLGSAESLPFEDSAFNRIMAVDSFHHFRDRDFAAKELLRVLAPHGRLIIEEPDIRRFSVKLVALGETLLFMRSHFQPPGRIMRYFDVPGIQVRLFENGTLNFWVIVDKKSS